jgi:hypothetical protein
VFSSKWTGYRFSSSVMYFCTENSTPELLFPSYLSSPFSNEEMYGSITDGLMGWQSLWPNESDVLNL